MVNIAAETRRSAANGPGYRYVIWLQGCSLRCPGCFNKEFQPFVPRTLATVEALAERILAAKGIEGVTFTGGEPMLQSECLSILSRRLREEGLSIVCYTGFTIEELKRMENRSIEAFLGRIDILIDGRYEVAKKANLFWRGSSNQRVHYLTRAYAPIAPDQAPASMEIVVGSEEITFTGILDEELMDRFITHLKNND